MIITKKSLLTGIEHTKDVSVTSDQLWQIDNKTDLIQRIVPHLSPAEREFLLTGITGEEWESNFPHSVD